MASVVGQRLLTASRVNLRRIPTASLSKPSTLQTRSAFTASRYVANGASPSTATTNTVAKPAAPSQPVATPAGENGPLDGPLPHFVGSDGATDWSRSYHGLSTQAFLPETAELLMAPIVPEDIEIKPDGLLYLPEIKYRRILNKAFGPGGWGLAPRSETSVGPKIVSREYALVCQGRLVAIARGEQEYFDPSGVSTATEGCKSNALMRCCKDLGIASELWDPRFIRDFKGKQCVEVFAEHTPTKKKKKLWRRKDQPPFGYPYKEDKAF
ncbi:mitochondrial genome maintenance MGM101 [Coprinellus micaceus]|uniref:Mitochondrial genome maintenance protein MGM101 n=1 Tax=Coprinellus micaceus TaxID=71717 RepID=A0A4Y7TSD9_COPMI|nr:mitochondrial genome maintenance MGM101 [Coprinellus micaceus]